LPNALQSRLLCLEGADGAVDHRRFEELPDLLQPQDLLVFNDTRVIPARVYGKKASGGQLEMLVERVIETDAALVHLKVSRTPAVGARLILEGWP